MSERLRKRIDALRVEYVKTFAEEAAGFRAEMREADTKGVASRAHRIAGTAGSYQLDDVCGAAQNVERLCEEVGLGGKSKSQGDESLAQCVELLCEKLEAAQLLFLQAAT